MTPTYRAQAPAKVLLFGEWAVLTGSPAVATCLDKYLTCELKKSSQLVFNDGENSYTISDANHVPDFFEWNHKFTQAFHQNFGIPTSDQYEWKWTRDWQLCEGLGSSSASFISALLCQLKLINHSSCNDVNALWAESFKIFKSLSQGSGADLAAQCIGGNIVFQKGEVQNIDLEIPSNLKIVHTGLKTNTQCSLNKSFISEEDSKEIAKSTHKFIEDRNWKCAIKSHHTILEKINVVPDFVKNFRSQLKQQNIIQCLKTTGAGGGDALLCLVNPDRAQEFENAVKDNGYWINNSKTGAKGAQLI